VEISKAKILVTSIGCIGVDDKVYDGTEIGVLWKGDAVTVTGTTEDTIMCRILFNGQTAYTLYDYLTDVNPNPTPTPTPEPEPIYTIEDTNYTAYADGIWIFKNPNLTGETEHYLPHGTKITVTGICKETGMYRINWNGITGYINPALGLQKAPEDFPYALNTLYENGDYQMYFYYNADDKSQRKEVARRAHELLKDKADAMGYTKYMVDEANAIDPNNIIKGYYNIFCITINLTILE